MVKKLLVSPGGKTFAAPGVQWAAPGLSAGDLTDYIYPEEPIGAFGPHIGEVIGIQPNGPAQLFALAATINFDDLGLHFINNYEEHFGKANVPHITGTQFTEVVFLGELLNFLQSGTVTQIGHPGQTWV